MHFYFLSFFFCLGTDIITESWSGSGRITEVTSTTELIDARGTLSTIEENKNESSVREVVSEPNYLPSTPATERSELVDYNLIDSDLFENILKKSKFTLHCRYHTVCTFSFLKSCMKWVTNICTVIEISAMYPFCF